eukprot:gnl/Dysnectes_brevis/6273_a9618_305.p1 GENE.gnl/Dysnectes_brevis/6273_a9618_305~~gnl/Dysnectes_brevis/6273_a9618_305.p1  ORF type:complete len:309 (-),score=131.69 gnl/Dysnectes_brevis/6273_a9618_305:96-1022(-)
MADAIEYTRKAFELYSQEKATVPLRTTIPSKEGTTLFMPALAGDKLGIKVVSVRGGNRARGISTVPAIYLDMDDTTGQVTTILDGEALTYLRTGAASGVAAAALARPDSSKLLVLGCGKQGHAAAEAICEAMPTITEIALWDMFPAAITRFRKWIAEKYPRVSVVEKPKEELTAWADIILTATTSSSPVFKDEDVQPGTHISGVGAYLPTMQEIPAATVARCHLVVDTRSGCLAEAGDILIPMQAGLFGPEHVQGEIGEITLGMKPGRTSDEQITFFKTVGSSCTDVVVGSAIASQAAEKGVGRVIEM